MRRGRSRRGRSAGATSNRCPGTILGLDLKFHKNCVWTISSWGSGSAEERGGARRSAEERTEARIGAQNRGSIVTHISHIIQLLPLISGSPIDRSGSKKNHQQGKNITDRKFEFIFGAQIKKESPKLLSAISAPVQTHLSPPSFFPSFLSSFPL